MSTRSLGVGIPWQAHHLLMVGLGTLIPFPIHLKSESEFRAVFRLMCISHFRCRYRFHVFLFNSDSALRTKKTDGVRIEIGTKN